MIPIADLWCAYTAQVLAWKLGTGEHPAACLPDQDSATVCARLARMHRASGREHCVLLGAGNGHLAQSLRTALPPEHSLLVLESDMATARAVAPTLPKATHLLADTSPWALLLLTCGVLDTDSTTLAWTLPHSFRITGPGTPILEKWRHFFTAVRYEHLPAPAPLHLVVGCILHPDEPHLEDFFAHIPAWIRAVAVVWDSHAPHTLPACAVPVYSVARPLDRDFSAQRNAMLELCRQQKEGGAGGEGKEWCLYLDADERLSPEIWEALPRLTACTNVAGVCFPRLTFERDTDHARMGYGLWPDIQLRLFALTPPNTPHFSGRVHETLHGLHGDTLLAPGLPIQHYSHVHKDRATLQARLGVFDKAAGKSTHILSHEYPRLPVSLLNRAGADFGADRVLRLP